MGLALTLSAPLLSVAQGYPTHPIRFILGFPAGGASDIVARGIGQKLTEDWGQQIVIDNRPGAAGIIASELGSHSAPDGYSVLLVSSSYANNMILYRKLPFDPMKDLISIGKVAFVPNVAVVPPSLPVRSIKDLIALARSKPGQIIYASGGSGTGTHLATELLEMMTHIDMVHVPYKGTPPALIDLVAGRIQLMLAGAPPALPQIRSGKLRAIAVTSAKRSLELPNVPAIAETVPGYEATTWYGFLAPAGTPKPIIATLNSGIRKTLRSPGVITMLTEAGFEPDSGTPEEFTAYMKSELAKWGKVAKAAKIEPE